MHARFAPQVPELQPAIGGAEEHLVQVRRRVEQRAGRLRGAVGESYGRIVSIVVYSSCIVVDGESRVRSLREEANRVGHRHGSGRKQAGCADPK